jgi:hypothetical protein
MSVSIEEALDRAEAEDGKIVGKVYCAQCGSEKTLAIIKATSEGLYYHAYRKSGITGLPPERVAQQKRDARAARVNLDFLLATGQSRYLLERDPVDQDLLRAECPKHGPQDLDVAYLIAMGFLPFGHR